jgi:hypothetical protein
VPCGYLKACICQFTSPYNLEILICLQCDCEANYTAVPQVSFCTSLHNNTACSKAEEGDIYRIPSSPNISEDPKIGKHVSSRRVRKRRKRYNNIYKDHKEFIQKKSETRTVKLQKSSDIEERPIPNNSSELCSKSSYNLRKRPAYSTRNSDRNPMQATKSPKVRLWDLQGKQLQTERGLEMSEKNSNITRKTWGILELNGRKSISDRGVAVPEDVVHIPSKTDVPLGSSDYTYYPFHLRTKSQSSELSTLERAVNKIPVVISSSLEPKLKRQPDNQSSQPQRQHGRQLLDHINNNRHRSQSTLEAQSDLSQKHGLMVPQSIARNIENIQAISSTNNGTENSNLHSNSNEIAIDDSIGKPASHEAKETWRLSPHHKDTKPHQPCKSSEKHTKRWLTRKRKAILEGMKEYRESCSTNQNPKGNSPDVESLEGFNTRTSSQDVGNDAHPNAHSTDTMISLPKNPISCPTESCSFMRADPSLDRGSIKANIEWHYFADKPLKNIENYISISSDSSKSEDTNNEEKDQRVEEREDAQWHNSIRPALRPTTDALFHLTRVSTETSQYFGHLTVLVNRYGSI